jgi:homoserine dehydrogenase
MFYGSGAGSLPTASAVVSDVIEEAKNIGKNIPVTWEAEKLPLADKGEFSCRFLVRTKSAKEKIEAAFGSVEYLDTDTAAEIAFLTGELTESDFEEKSGKIELIHRIRVSI